MYFHGFTIFMYMYIKNKDCFITYWECFLGWRIPMNSILIPQCDHVPLAFLIVPPFLLFCVFFHPPLQTVSVHDVDRSSLQSWSSLSSYKSMWIYIKNVIAQEYLPIWRMSYCDTYHTLYRWIKLPNKKRETLLNITLILCPETFDHDSPFLSVFIDILCWRDLVFRGLGSSINKCISVMFYVHSITAW